MKRVVIAIVIMVVFIAAGIGEQIYIKKLFKGFEDKAEEIRVLIEEENFELAHQKTVEMQEKWHDQKYICEAIISHNETKEITMRIAELEGYIAASDDKSAIATASIMSDYCHNLREILAFSLSTVF